MRKKSYGMLVVMLTVVISSTIPISGSDLEYFSPVPSETISIAPEPLVSTITEKVTIREDGSCHLSLWWLMEQSPLATLFREALGFDEPGIENGTEVPDHIDFDWNVTLGDSKVNQTHLDVSGPPNGIPIREPFLNALIQEHSLSLGIHILSHTITTRMWAVNGKFLVQIEAEALLQVVSIPLYWEIAIGPKDLNASYTRAGFILTKIGFIQHMLGSFAGNQTYNSIWNVEIELPKNAFLLNDDELIGKNWYVDFGNGTYMSSLISVASFHLRKVVLEETMLVTEQNITKTEKELVEQDLLCYKVFNIKCQQCKSALTYYESKQACAINDDWHCRWNLTLWDGSFGRPFTWEQGSLIIHATTNVTAKLDLEGYVGWEHKWLKLRKLEAWMALKSTLVVNITVHEANCKHDWDLTFFKWEAKEWIFWVGSVPVTAQLKFEAKVILTVEAGPNLENLSWGVDATGEVKAGVKWKRNKGWRRIYSAKMDVSNTDPNPEDVTMEYGSVTITPKLNFKLSLLFYRTAGPFVSFVPYAALTVTTSGEPPETKWYITVGISINVGITFAGFVKKILRLHAFYWTLLNIVLWEYPQPENHDVAVVDVRAPERALVNETVPISVDVINIGDNDEHITVTLYYENGSQLTEIDETTIYLEKRNWKTLSFTWYTTDMAWGIYDIVANAAIIYYDDDDVTNNELTKFFRLDIQNVAITSVTASPTVVFAGQSVDIEVTVENKGTVKVSALPVFAYCDSQFISDVWCEYMRMVFDLQDGYARTLIFTLDTRGVTHGSYKISGEATLLPYETNKTDNAMEDGSVTVYNLHEISIIDIVTCKDCCLPIPVVGRNYSVSINVTVGNQGFFTEIFNVTLYANSFSIGGRHVTLEPEENKTLTFTWDTTSFTMGNYEIIAKATPVEDETDIDDNTCFGHMPVLVSIPGDVNGNHKVDIFDAVITINAVPSVPAWPEWNPNPDIDNDGRVNIFDAVICIGNIPSIW